MQGTIAVYIRKYPFFVKQKDIHPKERKDEINDCKSEKVRDEKFFAWQLLSYAIYEKFNKNIEDFEFCKVGDKWQCKDFCFSISHCSGIVAVAISYNAVGLDIELISNEKFKRLNVEKILNDSEFDKYKNFNICNLWTKKEAVFKLGDNKFFNPKDVIIDSAITITKEITISDKTLVMSVAMNTKNDVEVKLIED